MHGNRGEETAYHSEADEIILNTAVGISRVATLSTVSSISPYLYVDFLTCSSCFFSSCFPHSYSQYFSDVMCSSYDLIYLFYSGFLVVCCFFSN